MDHMAYILVFVFAFIFTVGSNATEKDHRIEQKILY